MDWFRLYHSVATDSKVQTLPIDLRWRWVECLCTASANENRGVLPPLRQVAYIMRLTIDETRAAVEALVAAGLIDRNGDDYAIHDWDHYQKPSDSAAGRMRAYRERQRSSPVQNASRTVTSPLRNGDGLEKRREEENTPLPPKGAVGGGVLAKPEPEKPKPEPAPDDDPFIPPRDDAGPPPEFTPEERRFLATAERLFPGSGYGELAITHRMDLNVAASALADLKASGKSDWRYFGGIYRRLKGEADRAPAPAPPRPAPAPPPPAETDPELKARLRLYYAKAPGVRGRGDAGKPAASA